MIANHLVREAFIKQRKSSQPEHSPQGPHKTRPSEAWIEAFLEHVRTTGQPETFAGIDWTFPPAWSPPYILKANIDIERSKRPNGDMAPCAICSPTHSKCLNGLFLVYYEREAIVRVFGPDCGAKIEGGDMFIAEHKAFKLRERMARAEAKLERMLPLMPKLILALEGLRPALVEADRLYRKLRGDNSAIPKHFREVRKQRGGQLTVDVIIETPRGEQKFEQEGEPDGENDRPERVGPRGFGRVGGVDTYTQSYGALMGDSMFASEFRPLDKLDELLAVAGEFPKVQDGDGAFLWMCNNESLGLFELLVERLDELEAGYEKFLEQLMSVRSFFDAEYFARLNLYGQHRDTSFKLEASVDKREGVYTLIHQNRPARFRPDLAVLAVLRCWP